MKITTDIDRRVDAVAGTGSVTVAVEAPKECVFALVSNLHRMAEWSPECVGVDVDGQRLGVGSTFVGSNRRDGNEWTTPCTVVAMEAGATFGFFSGDEETGTTWTYRMRGLTGGATELSESFDSRRLRHPDWRDLLAGRAEQLVEDMVATLMAVKRAAERTAPEGTGP